MGIENLVALYDLFKLTNEQEVNTCKWAMPVESELAGYVDFPRVSGRDQKQQQR